MLMLKFCFFILFILVDKSVNCFTSKPFSLKRTIYFLPKGQYLNSECFNTRNSLRTKTDLKGTKLSKICINIYSKVSPSIVGGFLSGGLHAITGPDHLAAILPSSIGHSAWYGIRLGAIWGFGHGISAMILGISAFFLKGKFSSKFVFLEKMSNIAESIVGLSLIAIGLIGIKESSELLPQLEEGEEGGEAGVSPPTVERSSRAIFFNGVLHGFSLDGAPSILPAVAMSSWRASLGFLLSYCLGTMLAMALTAAAVAELSLSLGKAANSPDLPRKLSKISSLAAILIGVFWIAQASFLK